jgi:hypothetical protein
MEFLIQIGPVLKAIIYIYKEHSKDQGVGIFCYYCKKEEFQTGFK